MVDYNQALTVAEALARGRALDDEGVYWLEEPIRHDDYAGAARLARELQRPIQIGENFSEPHAMAAALAAGACDYVMPDLERIGGVTGWQRAAGLAAAHRIEMSSHLFPEVSAHLLAATPTRHWLEWVDWANAIVEEPLRIEDGFARGARAARATGSSGTRRRWRSIGCESARRHCEAARKRDEAISTRREIASLRSQ